MMRHRQHLFILAALLVLLSACGSSTSVTRDNVAYMYGKGADQLRLEARIYHHAPERSTLYYKLPTRDLLYKSDGGGGPYKAVLRITYEAFPEWGSKVLLDSASTLVHDKSDDPGIEKELIGSIDLRRNEHKSFVLRVTARDLNRETQATTFIRVDRRETAIRQYFMPVDPRNGLPYFTDHFRPGTTVKVRCDAFANATLQVVHVPAESTLPAPVFSNSTKKTERAPDTSFVQNVDADGTFLLSDLKTGALRFQLDSVDARGYSLFTFADCYPYAASPQDMLKPLRYITSMQEYERITKQDDLRKAIEKFWMDCTGDREKARDAIRTYYGRVESANRHFTSSVEGWRTDRGLVLIIFGTPTSIHKAENGETWVYGEENNLMSSSFTFVKRTDQLSDNDLVLERDPLLKGAWYRNVESWRNGRVYSN
ncbi:MAG: GWxTD domain-containing protein [Flavobacteriales bacterium]|nr:GWxTD domain-containing protein [Flavobacteriales bacterium]